jgi:hypothetical protein
MWTKQSVTVPEKYDVAERLTKPFLPKSNGIPKYDKSATIGWKLLNWSGKIRITESVLSEEEKEFGISLSGIKAGKEEMSIDPKKLQPNIFYLFSFKDEKYVARKSDNDVVEIYEVLE